MGKFIVRKILAAVLSSGVVTFIAAMLFASVVGDLKLENGNVLKAGDLQSFFIALFVLGAVVTAVTFIVTPMRRRRGRSSGTIVENDVEDGRERGTVKWFNMKKGFGFITWERGSDREDVFVHFRSIRGQGYRTLTEGQRVKFTIVSGDKGPQAEDVSAVR